MSKKNTAILVFTRSAGEEVENKVFEPTVGHSGNVKIAEKLIAHTCKMARQSQAEADVHIIDSDRQRGETFGERLANAFESLYQIGYQKVIAIGNDSPWIEGNLLHETVEKFRNRDAVLGPASDGGAYLIGMDRRYFDKAEFIALSWKTNRLFNELAHQLQMQGAGIQFLEMLSDIDSPVDFRRLIAFKSGKKGTLALIATLLSIIAGFNTAHPRIADILPCHIDSSSILLRGPPSISTLAA